MNWMNAFEFASTGALETSALHQLSAGNSGPGGDPGNAPPSTGCPAAPDAARITPTSAAATALVHRGEIVRSVAMVAVLYGSG